MAKSYAVKQDETPAAAPAHLSLWDQLSVTDPKFTKDFNRGGFKGTAINPTYIAKRLTEIFGPCGLGWMLVLDDERYEDGAPLDVINGVVVARETIHVVRGHLKYFHPELQEWAETGPQFGQTTFVGSNKNGIFTDEEAPKKSLTDCLSKCAALLGASADIYLGMYDGNKYVNDPKAEPVEPADALKAARSKSSGAGGSNGTGPANQSGTADTGKSAGPVSGTNTSGDKPQTPANAAASAEPVKKPRASRKAKTADAADVSGTLDIGVPGNNLPSGYAYWLPEQWSEFIDTVTDPKILVIALSEMRTIDDLRSEPQEFEGLCKQFASAARAIVPQESAEWNTLVKVLKELKAETSRKAA